MRSVSILFVVSALAASTLPASALVMVLGTGIAHDCFLQAKFATDPGRGVAICNRALEEEDLTNSDRAATYVNRGVLEAALGQNDRAMRDYNYALRLSPNLGDAYVDLGAALIFLKNYDEALAAINKGMALGLNYPHVGYFNRGVVEEIKEQFKEAYLDYKHALELEPSFSPASERLKFFTVITKPAAPAQGGT